MGARTREGTSTAGSILLLSVLAVLSLSKRVQSFSVTAPAQRYSCLWAKPPAKASFDMKALEAFEQQLDLADQLSAEAMGQNDLADDDDDDDMLLNDGGDGSSTDAVSFLIPETLDNERVDVAMVECQPELSRSTCADLIAGGRVWVLDDAGRKVVVDRKAFRLQAGQTLQMLLSTGAPPEIDGVKPEDIPLDVLYEDEHMIVINKSAGMVVHPAVGHWNGTVCNALAHYLMTSSPFGPGEFIGNQTRNQETMFRPGIVHRIDKGTTGALVVAKTGQALAKLSQAFKDRRVKKTYLAITVGNPGCDVKIDKPIARHPVHRQRMRVVPDPHRSNYRLQAAKSGPKAATSGPKGRNAISYVDTIAFNAKLALVKVRIVTGRTHQVRVHLQDRKTPIYGDTIYGLADWNKKLYKSHQLERPLLHAYRLELEHPVSRQIMAFEAPLPEDMERIAMTIDDSFAEKLAEQSTSRGISNSIPNTAEAI